MLSFDQSRPGVSIIAAVVARSPIPVRQRAIRPDLPAGFDIVDVTILEWIAAESRPLRPRRPLH